MRLNELYALTVVGLRRWPNPKTGKAEHSAQELIVTKDPIKKPIKPRRPEKGVKTFRNRWNPVFDAAHAAVAEGISSRVEDSSGMQVVRYDPDRIGPSDIAELVAEMVVDATASHARNSEVHHNKIFKDEEDPKFEHSAEVYEEIADSLLHDVREKLHDVTSRTLRHMIEAKYPKLPDVQVKKSRDERKEELK